MGTRSGRSVSRPAPGPSLWSPQHGGVVVDGERGVLVHEGVGGWAMGAQPKGAPNVKTPRGGFRAAPAPSLARPGAPPL